MSSVVFASNFWIRALGWAESLSLFEASEFADQSKSYCSCFGIVGTAGWNGQSCLGLRAHFDLYLKQHLRISSSKVCLRQLFEGMESQHSIWIVLPYSLSSRKGADSSR